MCLKIENLIKSQKQVETMENLIKNLNENSVVKENSENMQSTKSMSYLDKIMSEYPELGNSELPPQIELRKGEFYHIRKNRNEFGTYYCSENKEGELELIKISNAILTNLHVIIEDDGRYIKNGNTIKFGFIAELPPDCSGKFKKSDIVMLPEEFNSNNAFKNEIARQLGPYFSVEKGKTSDLRKSMQIKLPDEYKQCVIRSCTGWDKEHKNFYFIDSVISKDGIRPLEDMRVNVPEGAHYLEHYSLRNNSYSEADFADAIKSLKNDLLNVYSKDVTLPYFTYLMSCAVYDFVPDVVPTMVLLKGITGYKKTSYTAATMALFGKFNPKDFVSWTSTANSIASLGFYCKDLPFVVDDLKPGYVDSNSFVQLMHGYGNQAGRNRCSSSSEIMPDRYVRGNFVSTGEDIIFANEKSTMGRTVVLSVDKTADLKHLTGLQEAASRGYLGAITERFIRYLINNPIEKDEATNVINANGVKYNAIHPRTQQFCGMMEFTWELLKKVIPTLSDFDSDFKKSLKNLVITMNSLTQEQSSAAVFVNSIKSMLICDNVIIADKKHPYKQSGNFIGWEKDNFVYIIPDEALKAVNKHSMAINGVAINNTKQALYEQLKADRYIVPGIKCSTIKQRIPWKNESSCNVLRFKKEVFFENA